MRRLSESIHDQLSQFRGIAPNLKPNLDQFGGNHCEKLVETRSDLYDKALEDAQFAAMLLEMFAEICVGASSSKRYCRVERLLSIRP
jgi:hypothetical protein